MSNHYKCNHCVRSYKEKFNYDRHVSVCKFLSQPPREQCNDIELSGEKMPTAVELFQLVKHLSLRMDKLEKENQLLTQRNNKKVNVLEWLNQKTNKPIMGFERWIVDNIQPLITNTLEDAFRGDLTRAVCKLFDNYFTDNEQENVPICSFTKKNAPFYIYDKSKDDDSEMKWTILTNNKMDKYIEHICKQNVNAFIKDWYEPNQTRIESSEKYKDLYAEYYKKILGGGLSKDQRCTKIRNSIYNKIKRNIPGILEYDCE